jgi:hypothetical protein
MQRKWINGFMLDHSGWERMASLDQRKDYPILGNCVKMDLPPLLRQTVKTRNPMNGE